MSSWVSTVQRKRVSHGAAAAVVGLAVLVVLVVVLVVVAAVVVRDVARMAWSPVAGPRTRAPRLSVVTRSAARGPLHFFFHGYGYGCVWVLCAWYAR